MTPLFQDVRPDDPISEFALRVVVELQTGEMYVAGTATWIAGNLAVTAKHVLDCILRKSGGRRRPDGIEVSGYAVRLYQVLPGPIYRIWNVFRAWSCPSDIALLHIGLVETSNAGAELEPKSPRLRVVPPPVGHKIFAFGYRKSIINVTTGIDGRRHIVLDDYPTVSVGEITRIYPQGRDSVMLPFPCYEVAARRMRDLVRAFFRDRRSR